MPGCAVAMCRSHSRKSKGSAIRYHSFPRDIHFRKLWVVKCRRKDDFRAETSRVCSLHFRAEDYFRDLKAELLGLKPKCVLRPDAVPTMNLASYGDTPSPGNVTNGVAKRTNRKSRQTDTPCPETDANVEELFKKIRQLETANKKLSSRCDKLKTVNDNLKKELAKARRQLAKKTTPGIAKTKCPPK